MSGKEVVAASRFPAQRPRGREPESIVRDLIAPDREKILAALMDDADPNAPPTENEILNLILGEMTFMRSDEPLARQEPDRRSGG